jgi:hypothetical protein
LADSLSAEQVAQELARIEAAVDGGDTGLGKLGFWKLMALVKLDPALIEVAADPAGRIDAKAFDAFTKRRFPVWLGNLVLAIGVGVGAFAVLIARYASSPLAAGLALVAAAGIWSVAVHSPAHWVVGRALGMRFRCYFFGGPFPPRPGLKTDYASYLRTDARKRAWMHASGALATKVAPFVVLAFWPGSAAPAWAAWLVLAIGIVQILTDIFLSVKSSDWKKVKRELAVARSYT